MSFELKNLARNSFVPIFFSPSKLFLGHHASLTVAIPVRVLVP